MAALRSSPSCPKRGSAVRTDCPNKWQSRKLVLLFENYDRALGPRASLH